MKKLSVLAWPAKMNKDLNPYNYILYSNIEKKGVQVLEFSPKRLLQRNTYDLLHMHWPENIFLVKSPVRAYRNLTFFYFVILFCKLNRKQIVWTVHNLKPHENKFPVADYMLHRYLFRQVQGFISLTHYGADEILKKIDTARSQKIAVIPHPHYKNYYNNTISKAAARKQLALSDNQFVFLFIGQVRAYKNVTGLVKSFVQLKDPSAVLVIAGGIHQDVAEEFNQLLQGEQNILVFPEFVKDDDLQLYLNCADLVVTPYNRVLNSGSVFLNLSFNKPTLGPAMGAFPELQQTLGNHWIKTYEGKLGAIHLNRSMSEIRQSPQEQRAPIELFAPEKVAADTIQFYQSL